MGEKVGYIGRKETTKSLKKSFTKNRLFSRFNFLDISL